MCHVGVQMFVCAAQSSSVIVKHVRQAQSSRPFVKHICRTNSSSTTIHRTCPAQLSSTAIQKLVHHNCQAHLSSISVKHVYQAYLSSTYVKQCAYMTKGSLLMRRNQSMRGTLLASMSRTNSMPSGLPAQSLSVCNTAIQPFW